MENKYELKITPAAEMDLDEIYNYICTSLLAPISAQNLLDNIEDAIKKLCVFPYKCELSRNELLSQKGYRKLVVNNYLVLYLVDAESKTVIVTRVFYGGMDYEQHI